MSLPEQDTTRKGRVFENTTNAMCKNTATYTNAIQLEYEIVYENLTRYTRCTKGTRCTRCTKYTKCTRCTRCTRCMRCTRTLQDVWEHCYFAIYKNKTPSSTSVVMTPNSLCQLSSTPLSLAMRAPSLPTTHNGSTHPSYNSANSSALQATVTCGARGRAILNDTMKTTWVKGYQLSTIRVQWRPE